MLPGPLPLSSIAHSPPAESVVPQLVAKAKPVTLTCTPLASADPRLRRVRFGASSTERANAAVGVDPFAGTASFARYAAEPEHRLPAHAAGARTADRTVEGNAAVGAFTSGRSYVSVAKRVWLADG